MFKIAIVLLRECLEISIILSIIIALTSSIKNSRIYIGAGALLGVMFALLFAFFIRQIITAFSGIGDEIFDLIVILITICLISWTIIWMQGYTRQLKNNVRQLSEQIDQGLAHQYVLTILAASTVMREGMEIILYIYSIGSANNIETIDYILGVVIGAVSGFSFGILIYLGLKNFTGKWLFKISTILLIFIAAGLASNAAAIMTSSGIIEIFSDQVWDSSWVVDDRSILGRVLSIMIGYDSRPNLMQVIFYLGVIFINVSMLYLRKINLIGNNKKLRSNV